MSSNLVTARECIKAFEDIGVTMSEPSFSKYKKRGVFEAYHVEGKKRDLFDLEEVLTSFFEINLPKSTAEQKTRDQYYIQKREREKRKELFDNISIESDKLENHKELTFEMFDVQDLWISAAEALKELKDDYTEEIQELNESGINGEAIYNRHREYTILNASKTKEEHIEEFKRMIFVDNEANQYLKDFIFEALFDDLEKKYTNFDWSNIQLVILKSANDWIRTPEKTAESSGVDLVDSEK